MSSFEYIPDICKGETPKFSGSLKIISPLCYDRWDYLGKVDQIRDELTKDDKELPENRFMIEVMKAGAKMAEPFIESVDLTRLSDGKKFQSVVELYGTTDKDLTTLVGRIGRQLFEGGIEGK